MYGILVLRTLWRSLGRSTAPSVPFPSSPTRSSTSGWQVRNVFLFSAFLKMLPSWQKSETTLEKYVNRKLKELVLH
jgi:hypothetical protein